MTSQAECSIGTWEPADEPELVPAVLQSAAEAYGAPPRTEDWFVWKYERSPRGEPVIVLARDSQGMPRGMVAFGAQSAVLDDRPVRAGVSYDTYVAPEYQGQGLFTRMLAQAEDEARARGIEVLYNFPNPSSRPGFLRAGWTDMGGVETWLRPAARAAFAVPRAVTSHAAGAVDIDERGAGCVQALDRLDRESYRAPNHGSGVVGRSSELDFMRWRTADAPHRNRYTIVLDDGMAALVRVVTRRSLREVQVLEVLTAPNNSSPRLRSLFRAISRELRAEVVTVLLSAAHPVRPHLRGCGFVRVRNRASFFVKTLEGVTRFEDHAWSVSGLDIHTW